MEDFQMNFEQLKYIVVVANAGSILNASKKLHITQSALSQSITKVEKQLNLKIFERSRLGTTPTIIGKDVIEKSIELLGQYEQLKMIANASSMDHLRVGTISNSSNYLLKTLATFKKRHPMAKVNIVESLSKEIIEGVLQDRFDIGLIELSGLTDGTYDEDIEYFTLMRDEIMVAASVNSSLAVKKIVTPQEIIEHPLVIYNDQEIQRFINIIESKHGLANIMFSSNNLDAIWNTVTENLAIAVAPKYAITRIGSIISEKVVSVEIFGSERQYGLALVWARKKREEGITKRFLSGLDLHTDKINPK